MGLMVMLNHDDLVNLIVGFGAGHSYSIMEWLDAHGYGKLYSYSGGFHDKFQWHRSELTMLSDEELYALYKDIQQFGSY